METEAPSQETDAGGGLSTAEIGLIIGLTLSFTTLFCGSGVIWRLRKYIKKRRKERSQGDRSDKKKRSNELEAIERAGVSDSLLNNTSNQGARNSSGAGAAGSEGNVTEVDQSCNQGCGNEQAAEAEDEVNNIEASQLSVPPTEQAAEVLTNEYFMDLAQKIGSEWQLFAMSLGFTKPELDHIKEEESKVIYCILSVLQRWLQRTKIKDKREKVKFLCKALTKCGRRELSEQVKSDAGLGS